MTASMPPSRIALVLGTVTTLAACGPADEVTPGPGGMQDGCAQLLAGDLVISEIMPDPEGSPDEGKEWFEIWNATSGPLQLGGVRLTASAVDGSRDASHIITEAEIAPGEYFVLGDQPNDESLAAELDYGYGLDLRGFTNSKSGGRLIVSCGTSIIDDIVYINGTEGASRIFDGALAPDAIANDALETWCDSKSPWLGESYATPGARNDVCGAPTLCEGEDGSERDLVPPRLGDLIISEMLPNPVDIEDEDGEWFEVYVVNDVDLNGLALGRKAETLEIEDEVVGRQCLHAAAGSYLLFAANADPAVNGGLERVDHELAFSLSNSESGVFLAWNGEIIDAVTWNRSYEGEAWNLDPERFSPEGNDTLDAFCRATTAYEASNFGTPGAANVSCDLPLPAGMCAEEDGTARAIVPPGPGEILITEVMSNPAAVGDGDGEWFEVRVSADVDLNGLELGRDAGVETTVETRACVHVPAGGFAVFGNNADPKTNGGLPELAFEVKFSLVNSNGRVFVGLAGEVLDEFAWTSSSNGASTSLDPGIADPASNDDETAWCAATAPYGAGDLGTPGAENPACEGGPGPTGTCEDGSSSRVPVNPQPGDLVITEFMPDPTQVGDTAGEWFEVLATAAVDLNGLEIGRVVGTPILTLPAGGPCQSVRAGQRLVFARNADPAANGGLPEVFATVPGGLSLVQTNGALFLGFGGQVLDEITWASSTAGASTSVAPGSETPELNTPENSCASTSTYGLGDRGTPGEANDPCG